MIDAIIYVPDFPSLVTELDANHPEMLSRDEDGNLTDPPVVVSFARTPAVINGNKMLTYARLTDEKADEYRSVENMEILAEALFEGKGTGEVVYQKIKDDPEKLDKYNSVYDHSPREVDDGEGGTMTIESPFKFGLMAGA